MFTGPCLQYGFPYVHLKSKWNQPAQLFSSYDLVDRMVAAVNNASFPKGKISTRLHHDVLDYNWMRKRKGQKKKVPSTNTDISVKRL